MKWAPVVDEFKELDEEIMRNSMHFMNVFRRELATRLDTGKTYGTYRNEKPDTLCRLRSVIIFMVFRDPYLKRKLTLF